MISIDTLLGIIWTEGIEEGGDIIPSRDSQDSLPPIKYSLELLQKPYGSYEWVE